MAEGRARGRQARDRIWEHVRARERLGLLSTPAGVAAALGISRQALHYHILILERAGLLVRDAGGHTLSTRPRASDGQGGQLAVADDPDDPPDPPPGPRAARKEEIVAAVLILFVRLGRWPATEELRRETDLSASALRGYLAELEAEGRIERIHGGRAVMATVPGGGQGS